MPEPAIGPAGPCYWPCMPNQSANPPLLVWPNGPLHQCPPPLAVHFRAVSSVRGWNSHSALDQRARRCPWNPDFLPCTIQAPEHCTSLLPAFRPGHSDFLYSRCLLLAPPTEAYPESLSRMHTRVATRHTHADKPLHPPDTFRVVFDFLECSVKPTYYSLAHKGILQSYMRSWKFEGSNDAANWVCHQLPSTTARDTAGMGLRRRPW